MDKPSAMAIPLGAAYKLNTLSRSSSFKDTIHQLHFNYLDLAKQT